MTDSHAHLSVSPLDSQFENELHNFIALGGKHILNVSFDIQSMYSVILQFQKYSTKYPNLLLSGLGIHPEEFIKIKNHDEAKKIIDRYEKFVSENINNVKFIGETGLDYYVMFREEPSDKSLDTSLIIEMQKMAFARHVELAVKKGLPMTIHTRELQGETKCITDTLRVLCDHGKGKIKGSMHSYTGDLNCVNDILDLGLYIGFNAIVTFRSGENVREILRKVPLNRILLETDAPFLALRNGGVKYGSPSEVKEIAKVIAEVKGVSIEEILKVTDENFEILQN